MQAKIIVAGSRIIAKRPYRGSTKYKDERVLDKAFEVYRAEMKWVWSQIEQFLEEQADEGGPFHKEAPTEIQIVSGAADGVDQAGEHWQKEHPIHEDRLGRQSLTSLKRFPAEWWKNGRSAGMLRNQEMARYADMALIIMRGDSKGSLDMAARMRRMSKPCKVVRVGPSVEIE